MILGIYPNITPNMQTKNNQKPYAPNTNYKAVNKAIPFGMAANTVLDVLSDEEKSLLKLTNRLPEQAQELINRFLGSTNFNKSTLDIYHSLEICSNTGKAQIYYSHTSPFKPVTIELFDEAGGSIAGVESLNDAFYPNNSTSFKVVDANKVVYYFDKNGQFTAEIKANNNYA